MNHCDNLIISICNRCNMRCRHCSNEEMLNDGQKADPEQVLHWLDNAAEAGVRMVTFVGGEPFLLLDDLRLYIGKAKELGIKSCIITNGYWAKTKDKAQEILQSLPGLHSILVSSDIYHLEHIDSQVIKNALNACLELKIEVAINATCASKAEKAQIREIYTEYKNVLFIHTHMMMPIGAAKELPLERWALAEKIDNLPRLCGIGNFLVELNGEVHGCCNAILPAEPLLYVGNMAKEELSELMQKFSGNPLFHFIKEHGPRGIGEIFKESHYFAEFEQKCYTCECDFCIDILGTQVRQQYLLSQIS